MLNILNSREDPDLVGPIDAGFSIVAMRNGDLDDLMTTIEQLALAEGIRVIFVAHQFRDSKITSTLEVLRASVH